MIRIINQTTKTVCHHCYFYRIYYYNYNYLNCPILFWKWFYCNNIVDQQISYSSISHSPIHSFTIYIPIVFFVSSIVMGKFYHLANSKWIEWWQNTFSLTSTTLINSSSVNHPFILVFRSKKNYGQVNWPSNKKLAN